MRKTEQITLEAAGKFTVSVLPTGRIEILLNDVDGLPEPGADCIYDKQGAANRLGTTVRSIDNYMRQKRNPLPYSKAGGSPRFSERDIQQWLENGMSLASRRARSRDRV
jgi:predicted DNA-binding transcriptional regulator AlpA